MEEHMKPFGFCQVPMVRIAVCYGKTLDSNQIKAIRKIVLDLPASTFKGGSSGPFGFILYCDPKEVSVFVESLKK